MMIKLPIVFSDEAKKHIDCYDLKDYKYWNIDCPENKAIRSELRHFYKKSQRFCCAYCQQKRHDNHGAVWDIDHIIPKQSNPEFMYEPKNLTVTCKDCNTHKGLKPAHKKVKSMLPDYPISQDDYLIFHPHLMDHEDHYILKYDDDHTPYFYEIKSDIGGYTFKTCNLKRVSEIYAGFAVEEENGNVVIDTESIEYFNLIEAVEKYISSNDEKFEAYNELMLSLEDICQL